ncbi:hypothetical protein JOQ06_017995 [Pogonophryne albipinna]|uniref:Uncharacterized protein n=1 Tax=Pogonophryne albipinna TaxID=1090488 RepID=A0AAD6F948_9TELE|nr:hypothetical protein JOQ06_017995 [Pogonophryne albipinna]
MDDCKEYPYMCNETERQRFLCLKNIRTFLAACSDIFGMKKSELFEAFDLFDVRDFGKVRQGCSVTHVEASFLLRKAHPPSLCLPSVKLNNFTNYGA